jgi:excisionase family DNA binding protein
MKLSNVNIIDCLSIEQAAKLKGVSKAAIYKAIKENRLNFVEIGKIKLVVKDSLFYK